MKEIAAAETVETNESPEIEGYEPPAVLATFSIAELHRDAAAAAS